LSCAAALATLDIVERELLPRIPPLGERLLAGLRRLAACHPTIGDVRGLGLMAGLELVADRAGREPAPDLVRRVVRRAFERGLLVLPAGRSTLRLAPPLVVDEQDIDVALEILDGCLRETW